jgi:hypothetical protein
MCPVFVKRLFFKGMQADTILYNIQKIATISIRMENVWHKNTAFLGFFAIFHGGLHAVQ